MKKRVLMFAVVMGMLLSACSSVWAAEPNYSKLDCVAAAYKVKHNVDAEAGSTFSIPIQGQVIAISNTGTGYESGKPANITFSFTSNPAASFESVSIVDTTIPINDITEANGYFYTTKIKGKVKGNGTITVKGSVTISGKTQEESAIIEFTTQPGNDVMDSAFVVEEPYEEATKVDPSKVTQNDPGADPDDNEKYNGKDPTFGTKGGNNKDKPKIATSKPAFTGTGYTGSEKALKSGVPATFEIEIQGPGPLIDVYVSAKDAQKIWPLECDPKQGGKEQTENISLTQENIKKWKIPFRVTADNINTDETQDKNTKHKLTIAYNGAQVAYKGFPITISAENDKTGTKPVTKTYKIDIVSDKQVPQWVTPGGVVGENLTKKNADEIPVSISDSGSLGSVIYTVSADGPYYITSKGGKLGMSAEPVQPELNRFGEVVTPGYVKVYGKFASGDKEVKEAFTLDAVGSFKKTSFKPTVVGKVSPYFEPKNLMSGDNNGKETSYAGMPHEKGADGSYTYDGYYKVKTAEAGKVPSVKIAAKGSKTIEYSISDAEEEKLKAVNLTFNGAKGQVEQLAGEDGKKVPTTATIDEDGEYAPIELHVTADNGVGTATVKALVGVTGAKAKPYLGEDENGKEIKTLLIQQNAKVDDCFTVYALVGKEEAGDDDNVHFRLADAKKAKDGKTELEDGEDTYALENLGLRFIPSSEFTEDQKAEYRNCGVFKVVSTLKAVKSQKVNLIVSNLGNEQKGTVTIAIVDPTPEIAGDGAIEVTAGDKVTKTYTLSAGEPTNGAKINWKIATKPDSKSKLSAKLSNPKNGKETDYTQAILEVTAKADATDGTLTITAENAESKLKSNEFTVNITVASAGGGEEGGEGGEGGADNNTSAPNTKKGKGAPAGDVSSKPENEDENESEEADALEFGAQRTADQLTAGQKAFLAEKGYTVVAVLPEVKATADGQYEFEVELDEDAPEGAKLIWLAFPKDAEENEDDKIADFYNEAGEAIEEVPAGKVIVVAPWLRAGVTYQPVVAVEN